MRLLVVRHGIAVDRGTPGIPDDERPLTPRGEERFREAARGLAELLDRPDAIFTSPLPRARRTAELLAEAFGGPEPRDVAALAQGSFEGLAVELARLDEDALVVLVGHEPDVSALVARLVGSDAPDGFVFRKGGVALLEVDGALRRGSLVFFAPPKLLRLLA
jgi:phosphohistidine phosphatase